MLSVEPSALTPTRAIRSHILYSIFSLMSVAVSQYKDLASFPEIFGMSASVLATLEDKKLPAALREIYNKMRNTMVDTLSNSLKLRLPLRMQAQSQVAVPIQSLVPEFDEHFTVHSGESLKDREAIQLKAIKKQIKREEKGVARELRLDAAFLADEKEKERKEHSEEKEKKRKEVWSWLEQQQATFKQMAKQGPIRGGGAHDINNLKHR